MVIKLDKTLHGMLLLTQHVCHEMLSGKVVIGTAVHVRRPNMHVRLSLPVQGCRTLGKQHVLSAFQDVRMRNGLQLALFPVCI